MAIPGNWTIFFDWSCDGTYNVTSLTVNADGTFVTGDGFSGLWVEISNMVILNFNNLETTYAGYLSSKSITGVSSTFSGLNGCFYMLQEGVPATFAIERKSGQLDITGNTIS